MMAKMVGSLGSDLTSRTHSIVDIGSHTFRLFPSNPSSLVDPVDDLPVAQPRSRDQRFTINRALLLSRSISEPFRLVIVEASAIQASMRGCVQEFGGR